MKPLSVTLAFLLGLTLAILPWTIRDVVEGVPVPAQIVQRTGKTAAKASFKATWSSQDRATSRSSVALSTINKQPSARRMI